MDVVDIPGLREQLKQEHCELNHELGTNYDKRGAVDYIIQPSGYTTSDIGEVAVRETIVPVCADCIETMLGNDWILFYCIECCCSQWVYKKLAQNYCRHNILWLLGCPECSEEFGRLYFSGIKAITGNPLLVSRVSMFNAA